MELVGCLPVPSASRTACDGMVHFGCCGEMFVFVTRRACQPPNRDVHIPTELSSHTPHASHHCHALRYHIVAHDGGGPMPPSALSVENCGDVVWRVARCFFFRAVRPYSSLFSSDRTLKSSQVL